MKVCIYGTGAIGGLIAARLARAGECDVSVIARGATLRAVLDRGLTVQQGGAPWQASVRATDDPAQLGAQDLVVLAVKATGLAEVATRIGPLLGVQTIVLPAMNGVPWWFSQTIPALQGQALDSVDPAATMARAVPLPHVLGCVVHLAAAVIEPAVIEHRMGERLLLGEPLHESLDGPNERLARVQALLAGAGFEAVTSADIRKDLWYKLWGNLTMNPLSAVTGATTDRLLGDPLLRGFCSAAMREAASVGERIGCPIDQSPEDRHAVTAKLGAIKTSMLQDAEAGRPLELDAIVGAVREIAQRLSLPTPNIDAILGLTRVFAQSHGLVPERA